MVTLVTRASEPFLSAAMLGNDVHINALGAIFPTHAELQPSVLARADLVAVDNLVNTQQASRELREHFGENNSWHRVRTLGEMIASRSKRPVGARLTIFKSVGMGLCDLAIAIKAYEAAKAQNRGTGIDYPVPAAFHWTEKRQDVHQ
ncbi:MAG: ornithine cyclodeaminase [Bradyrhizobium sp.]|nr:ornithine cyclodeaminase [Bradyrhizobium sp.]